MSKVLKADGTAGNSFVYLDFVARDEVWLTFRLAFDAAALADRAFGDFATISKTTVTANGFPNLFSLSILDTADLWFTDNGGPGAESGTPIANTWQLAELHYNKGIVHEAWVDGSLLFAIADINTVQASRIDVGQRFGGEIAYIDDVKLGTTRGASDLFSDDFESGSLSAWTGTSGVVSIVDDPFPAAPPAPGFPFHRDSGAWGSFDNGAELFYGEPRNPPSRKHHR